MTEIILNLAALLLALFCLVYGLRRRPGALPRRGLSALRGDAHALLTAMAAVLALCAAAAVAEGVALAFGAGAGVLSGLRGAQLVLQIGLLIVFILYVAALLTRGGDAPAALPLLLVAAVGVAVRFIWHVRVDLFFEAVALFGATALRRRGEDPRGVDRRFRGGATAAVALTLLAVIIMNVALILNLSRAQSDEIGVESEKGLGTTFTVTVALGRVAPEALPDAPAQAKGVPAGASIAGRRVLIAEDQELNAEVLTDLLEMEDVTCEWAENGQKAVEMFEKSAAGHFDAILMDMRMPVMDGLTAAREIRKLSRPDARTIPIVALTANAFEEDVRQCLETGMNAHLSKPVDIDKLRETLGGLL